MSARAGDTEVQHLEFARRRSAVCLRADIVGVYTPPARRVPGGCRVHEGSGEVVARVVRRGKGPDHTSHVCEPHDVDLIREHIPSVHSARGVAGCQPSPPNRGMWLGHLRVTLHDRVAAVRGKEGIQQLGAVGAQAFIAALGTIPIAAHNAESRKVLGSFDRYAAKH